MNKIVKLVFAVALLLMAAVVVLAQDVQYAEDGRYPAEPVKICVETFDPTDPAYMGVQAYLSSIAETVFNVEYIYSEAIASAEQELQFVENCAAAGGQGYIAYYNVSRSQVIARATELGIYYWGVAEEPDIYEEFQDNPYYLGSVINGNGDYDGMYAITSTLIERGRTKFVYASGGADFGITMFINRRQGFQDAVDEAVAAGTEITVTQVPGFPDESWFAAQGAAVAGDLDAVITSFVPELWIQPLAASGKAETVTIGAFSSINPPGELTDMAVAWFNSNVLGVIAAEPSERFGIAIAQIVNAVDGNADALEVDGLATNLEQQLWIVRTGDEYAALSAFEGGEGRAEYSQQLVTLIKNINPDASVEVLQAMIDAYTLEAIMGVEE